MNKVVPLGVAMLLMCQARAPGVLADFVDIRTLLMPDDGEPKRIAGISNAGDVFGDMGAENAETGIRWLRNDNYEPEDIGKGSFNAVQPRGMSSDGIVTGRATSGPWHVFRYDVATNKYRDLGVGEGRGGNNLGLVTADTNGEDPRVVDDSGTLQVLSGSVRAINDNNVIVGTENGDPIKWEPIEDGVWGEAIVMQEYLAFGDSQVVDISDNTFAVGRTFGEDFSLHGVVWDVTTGNIVADFGFATEATRINGAGTLVVGLAGFPPLREPMLWARSGEDWSQFGELLLNDVLNAVPSGDEWGELTGVAGVNDNGQIVGKGTSNETFAEQVFLLDTMELGLAVIKGDMNNDSVVDFLDITPFINAQVAEGDEDAFLLLTPDGCFICADIDMDGAIDFLDITPFVNLLDEVAAAVPEPASVMLLVVMGFHPSAHRPAPKTV